MTMFMKPAVALMDRVRYPAKFTIIFTLVLIPLVVLGINLVKTLGDDIDFIRKERLGLQYAVAIRNPLEHLQQHRGMLFTYLNGARQFEDRLIKKRALIDNLLARLVSLDKKIGATLDTGHLAQDIMSDWNRIKSNANSFSASESLTAHNALITRLLELLGRIADASQITLDPKLDSYYLGDAIVSSLPRMIDYMGRARALASGIAARGQFPDRESYTKLAILSNNIGLYFDKVHAGLDAAYDYNPSAEQTLRATTDANNSAILNMQHLIKNRILESRPITITPEEVFDTATAAISDSYALYDALIPFLDNLFSERIQNGEAILNTVLSVSAVVLAVLLYLFAGFYFSVKNSINSISQAAEMLAKGDLTARVSLSARDEMDLIADSFNLVADKFGAMVAQIADSSQQLASASEELSSVTEQTSHSMHEQQAQTEQVATAMHQMGATVQEVSSNIATTAHAAEEANQQTEKGAKLVEQSVIAIQQLAEQIDSAADVIHRLEKDSEEISAIMDVIRGVAEQTNLLALNAAIEAARAGEQGRGFAVVADEVRTLAGRTQQSTEEINQMIERLQLGSRKAVEAMNRSRDEAQAVVSQATEAGSSLSAIAESVRRISDMSNQIASAAEQQTATANEINDNISAIAQMTTETSTGAHQTATSAEELARLAAELQTLVCQFKVSSK